MLQHSNTYRVHVYINLKMLDEIRDHYSTYYFLDKKECNISSDIYK